MADLALVIVTVCAVLQLGCVLLVVHYNRQTMANLRRAEAAMRRAEEARARAEAARG